MFERPSCLAVISIEGLLQLCYAVERHNVTGGKERSRIAIDEHGVLDHDLRAIVPKSTAYLLFVAVVVGDQWSKHFHSFDLLLGKLFLCASQRRRARLLYA
jgi:hypothetical protein